MNYFEQLAENFAQQLIRPRRYNYSEQLLQNFFIDNSTLHYKFFKAPNKRQQLLDTLLVKKHINNQSSKGCIIYAHGLGSNKLQVLSILKHLRDFPYDVCSFDFSGSGKSQGKYTSYGLREQEDVSAILKWLDQKEKYQEYVLWGRSMGSVAIIMSQGVLLNAKVRSIILDSPFSSFQKVSLQIASKKSFIPQLFLQPLLSYLKQYFEKKSQFNPFTVNIVQTIKNIDRKILFIYSKNDSIVSFTHSMKLKLNCKYAAQEIEIGEDHNMQRPKETHLKAYNFILKNSQQSKLPTRIINIQTENACLLDQTLLFDKFQSQELHRVGKSLNRNRGISLTSKETYKEKENNAMESNRMRRIGNSSFESNSKAKINLVITQTTTGVGRKNRESKAKSSAIKLGSSNNSEPTSFITHQKSSQTQPQNPSILLSLNSVDTVDSHALQLFPRHMTQDSTIINYPSQQSTTEIVQISHQHQHINNTSNSKKTIIHNSNNNQNRNLERVNSFYSGSFMDENLNLLCSINSICLNRRKNKENILRETPKISNLIKQTHKSVHLLKQNQQANHQSKQIVPQASLTKEKHTGSNVKRPSIQLRRRNRFVF